MANKKRNNILYVDYVTKKLPTCPGDHNQSLFHGPGAGSYRDGDLNNHIFYGNLQTRIKLALLVCTSRPFLLTLGL